MYCLYGARIDAFVVTVRGALQVTTLKGWITVMLQLAFSVGIEVPVRVLFSLLLFLMCDFLGVCRPQLTFFIVVHVNLHANSAK